MKNFTTLVSTLLLTLTLFCVNLTAQTLTMYDVPITAVPDPDVQGAFKFSLDRDAVIHRRVRFVIKLLPSNLPTALISDYGIKVTPDITSSSPVNVNVGVSSPATFNYATTGEKQLRISYKRVLPSGIVDDDVTVLKLVVRDVQASYQKPDETWTVTTSENFTPMCESAAYPNEKPQKGFASVYIKYGTGHNNKLVRPFIFVDGIDFDPTIYTDPDDNNKIIRYGNTGWDVLTMGADDGQLDEPLNGVPDHDAFEQYPLAFQKLIASTQANGGDSYDIMFVDFSSGADYIQRNSLLLQEVLRQVNQKKIANAQGRINKNVVLGASMGGLVVRHALTSMEKRGENHCTHTYVSFDAPQKGANIPLSIQAMGWFLNKSLDIPAAQRFWKNLSMPAARQLLIKHFGDFAQNGGASIEVFNWSENFDLSFSGDYACLRAEFVGDMNKLDYPKDARNIAISCGSTLGNALANQGFQAGSEFFDADVYSNLPNGNAIRGGQVQMYASGSSSTWSPQSDNDHYVMYRCHPNLDFNYRYITGVGRSNVLFAGALPIITDAYLYNTPWAVRTPCKYNGVVVRNTFPTGLNMDHVQGCKRTDFGTIKRLLQDFASNGDVSLSLDNATYQRSFCFMPTMSTLDIQWDMTQANLERIIELDQLVRQNLTPFAAVYAPSPLQDGGKNLKHVEISQSMVAWLQGEMQIGEAAGGTAVTLPNANTQQVVFAKDGVISRNYTVNQNGVISLNGDPSVKVGIGSCGNVQVLINDSGNFNIGSTVTVGQVTLKAGGVVRIASGGNLNLTNNSQLIVESGGRLVIDGGANVNLVGSESTIYVKQGGELVINGDMFFSGNGFFQFDAGHILTLGADLVLTGSGKTTRMIRLNPSPQTTFNTLAVNGRGFNLSNALVEYGNNRCRINVTNDNTRVNTLADVTFAGSGNGSALNFTNVSNVSIQRCDFNGLAEGININSNSNLLQTVDIGQTNFSLVDYGISIISPTWNNIPSNRSLLIHDCTFNYAVNGFVNTGTACRFQNMMNVGLRFERNTINGYQEAGLWEDITGIELKNASITVVGGLISSCKTGISGEKDMNNNVLLNNGAEISNCEVGIKMVGGNTSIYDNLPYGLVEMRCIRLLRNGVAGIQGTDVELGISGYDTYGNNTFQNIGNSLLFDICYATVSVNFDATHNYWIGGFRNMRFRLRNGRGSGCSGAIALKLQIISELGGKNFVVNCNSRPTGVCNKTPLLSDGNGTLANGTPLMCLMGNNPTLSQKASANKSDVQKKKNVEEINDLKRFFYPNPANESVNLDIEKGSYHLRVLNTVGQTIFTQNTEGATSVNVATWTNGIYLFELTDKATNKQQRHKIIVQH